MVMDAAAPVAATSGRGVVTPHVLHLPIEAYTQKRTKARLFRVELREEAIVPRPCEELLRGIFRVCRLQSPLPLQVATHRLSVGGTHGIIRSAPICQRITRRIGTAILRCIRRAKSLNERVPSDREAGVCRHDRSDLETAMNPTADGPIRQEITWDDFMRVELRVGRVLAAEPFPEARKPAYKLQVDFGPEIGIRKSSAQITALYSPEDLVGRLVVAVVNFPRKQIGPFMSECLVTGFHNADGHVALCIPEQDVPLGSRLL